MALPRLPADDADERDGEVTEEEGWAILDRAARRYLGISGEEFVRRWKAGEYPDPDGTPVLRVAMLLPFARDRL